MLNGQIIIELEDITASHYKQLSCQAVGELANCQTLQQIRDIVLRAEDALVSNTDVVDLYIGLPENVDWADSDLLELKNEIRQLVII